MTTKLICTIGGSHEPIIKAIKEAKPDYICFVCSDDDPASGQKGSYVQITGKGNIIRAHPSDPKPSLPNIPTQLELASDQFEVIKVLTDNFDDVYHKVLDWLNRQNRNEDRILADYTGGTKTMSAALAVAALDCENVDLQLVSGSRINLVKVESGAEQVHQATVENTRFRRKLAQAVAAWNRFAYEETVATLKTIRPPRNPDLQGDYYRALDLSRALAAWDRFDHKTALRIFQNYRPRIGQSLGRHIKALEILNEPEGRRRHPLQLYDLWVNAQRRATQNRYDDAVARVYRLLEWTAQWQLQLHASIDTANIRPEQIPSGVEIPPTSKGCHQAGLYQAWQLIGKLLNNEAARFFEQNDARLYDRLRIRNQSILAHGFEPIREDQWRDMESWLQTAFIPMLVTLAQKDGRIRFPANALQLPQDFSAL